jgi:uncharacterized membrane protein
MNSDHSFANWIGNVFGVGTLAATWAGWMPMFATIMASTVAFVWYMIQIHESETVRRYLASRRARKIARLRAKLILLEAKPPLSPAPDA